MICSSENRDLRICHPLRVEDSANSWPEFTGLGHEARIIDELIEELKAADPKFHDQWIELLAVYPKADVPREFFDAEEDYLQYIEALHAGGSPTIGTLGKIYVKSLEEKRIADWLWTNSVEFNYEFQVEVTNEDETTRFVHPDFYYPRSKTIHEHFAIRADGTSPFPDYVMHAQQKRMAYKRGSFDFFETISAQVSDGTIFEQLASQLRRRSILLERRTNEEIENALDPVVIKRYHNVIRICVNHIRASNLNLKVLHERAKSLHDKPRAKRFVDVVWKIAAAYSRKLNEEQRIDFDSMIADAVRLVEDKLYKSKFRLILVDEFQDISASRANLIKALKHQRPFTKLFAVGDDWQSIYRFAGSDISLFTRFEQNFGVCWQGRLQNTYRSNQLLAETAAQFVQRNPEQLKKTVQSTRAAIPKSIRVIPVEDRPNTAAFDKACKQLLSRLDRYLGGISDKWRSTSAEKLEVLVLWRYNHLNPFKHSMPTFPNIQVNAMSFHRAKGSEADYTILLDVSEGDYGVPSRIEDDELLNLVLPNPELYPYAEERRLLYVALTRAKRGAFILTSSRKPSRYVDELRDIAGENVRYETVKGRELDLCPLCKRGHMVAREGPHSRFFGCSEYPDCRHTRPAS